jgi:hypothetical protein
VNDIAPSLAGAHFIAFTEELSGIDSLHQAVNYYQIVIVQARPELQARIRLQLGKIYLELMYYTNETRNGGLAIDCFERVLETSEDKAEILEASNGKSECLWWDFRVVKLQKLYRENEQHPF